MTPFARYCEILESLRRSPEDEARELRGLGLSYNEISARIGLARETIRRMFPATRQTHGEAVRARYWALREQGASIRAAAREMGLNRGTVQWWEDESKRKGRA
jgi:transposase